MKQGQQMLGESKGCSDVQSQKNNNEMNCCPQFYSYLPLARSLEAQAKNQNAKAREANEQVIQNKTMGLFLFE